MELVLNMLAETSSTEISKAINPNGFDETKETVIKGSSIAKMAREQIEKETGKKVISEKIPNIENLTEVTVPIKSVIIFFF